MLACDLELDSNWILFMRLIYLLSYYNIVKKTTTFAGKRFANYMINKNNQLVLHR